MAHLPYIYCPVCQVRTDRYRVSWSLDKARPDMWLNVACPACVAIWGSVGSFAFWTPGYWAVSCLAWHPTKSEKDVPISQISKTERHLAIVLMFTHQALPILLKTIDNHLILPILACLIQTDCWSLQVRSLTSWTNYKNTHSIYAPCSTNMFLAYPTMHTAEHTRRVTDNCK